MTAAADIVEFADGPLDPAENLTQLVEPATRHTVCAESTNSDPQHRHRLAAERDRRTARNL